MQVSFKKALLRSLPDITESLMKMSVDRNKNAISCQESKDWVKQLHKSGIVFVHIFWKEVMNKFHKLSSAL